MVRARGGARLAGAALVLALVTTLATATTVEGAPRGSERRARPGPAPAAWVVRPGVEQVTVTGAEPGQALTLATRSGRPLLTLLADEEGGAHFAYLPAPSRGRVPTTLSADPEAEIPAELFQEGTVVEPGRYTIRADGPAGPVATSPFEVLARDDEPDPALYERQRLDGARLDVLGNPLPGASLEEGYSYVEVRDGVTLSAMVRFPDPGLYGPGPWPTVIEYSGYGPSNPEAEEPGARLARTFGYATVSVNMRGTGCSGGVFDIFNPAQHADGYDVVETVARQPWVLHHEVGMVGLSYSGISQLYVASTRPPSLAAVLPQSVIADPWLEQWPGGIYNGGFTRSWLAERAAQSAPGGTSWVSRRIASGDAECAANESPHRLNPDFERYGRALVTYPELLEARDLRELVGDIEAPVYLTGAFQDEQTGAQFGQLLDRFDDAAALRVGMWNGRHPDGYAPANLVRWFEFLELYVARRVPRVPPVIRAAAPPILADAFGLADTELEPDRFDAFGRDDVEAALASYEDEDPVRVVFESGIGGNEFGEPVGTFALNLPEWPPPEGRERSWYLGPDERLTDEEPGEEGGVDSFRSDPAAGATTLFESSSYSVLSRLWDTEWTRFADGRELSYLTAPLADDLVVTGPGYVDLFVSSDAPDADVQVSVSEVRADGTELLVQNGWLRLGHRAVDGRRSDGLEVVHPFTAEEYEPLVPGEVVRAQVDLPVFAHAFRAGSRLRLSVATPGRNSAIWEFEPVAGTAVTEQRVARTEAMPSALVLGVLEGVDVPPARAAPCPSLRGMACRPFVATENREG